MGMDWNQFVGHTLTVTLHANFGVVQSKKREEPDIYETVIKSGNLLAAFDDGLLLEAVRSNQLMKVFIPYESIKLVEIH